MIRLISKDGFPGQISLKPSFLLVQLSIILHAFQYEWKFHSVICEIQNTQKIAIKILNELCVGRRGKC